MASLEARQEAIKDAARLVRSGNLFVTRSKPRAKGHHMGNTPKNLEVTDFRGTVLLKASQLFPDGNFYCGVTGEVSVLSGQDATGFEIKDDSNWFARIENEAGGRSVNILGCQVKMILQGDFDSNPPNLNFLQMG